MFKLSLNRIELVGTISPLTPLLISTGNQAFALLHPELPEIRCMRMNTSQGYTVYIPGTSIKGALRFSAERVLRSLGMPCCDPLSQKSECSQKHHSPLTAYKESCYACRTFGSQSMRSRVTVSDALPTPETFTRVNLTERRSGIAIERKTGGPSPRLVPEMEVVTAGSFTVTIWIENIQLWQVALLGMVLHELDDGMTRLGYSKSRGLGHVTFVPAKLSVNQIAQASTEPSIRGIAHLRPDLKKEYGLIDSRDHYPCDDGEVTPTKGLFGSTMTWEGPEAIWSLIDRISTHTWPSFVKSAEKKS